MLPFEPDHGAKRDKPAREDRDYGTMHPAE
jgi:hypothetical protein